MSALSRHALLALALVIPFGNVSALPVPSRWDVPKTKTAAKAPAVPDGRHARPSVTPSVAAVYTGAPPVAVAHAVQTPPLRDMKMIPPPFRGEEENRIEPVHPARPTDVPAEDGKRQTIMEPASSAPVSAGVSFEGIGTGLPGFTVCCVPPDTNGHVGATQYVQWNNLSFAVWDKNGNKLYGPAGGNTLFLPLGGVCATHNDGDPVVNYDVLAGRWILSQLAIEASPGFSHQCVAVSLTSDATGAWYLYDFVTDPVNFVDYPHMAVWPDGYYMAAHIFDGSGSSFLAGRIYAFERDKMLSGQPARMLSKDLKQYSGLPQYGFLAADLDSPMPPPSGEAEFVIGPDPISTSLLDSTRVAVTWGATPAMAFTETQISATWGIPPCVSGGRACVPQPPPASGSDYLDNLDQHMMHRLGYRNFGGSPVQESLVGNITVAGSASNPPHGAIRWFEFRNAGNSTATPTVYQAGTFDPDSNYRWMGSAAMDKDHDIALGYSKSSTTVMPSIFVNGRLGTDPLNTLGTETQMMAGGGVQFSVNRWGDYSSMTLDPVDQCTFWYTNEYLPTSGSYNWATRIGSFKFPSCTPVSWGNVSGTVTSCATGAPIGGVIVSLSNGYSVVSDASGHYAVAVPAGTYSATAAGADLNCSSSSPATVSVIVPINGTVTQDFCMSGSSKLEFGTVSVNDTAAGNGNGVINRNECVDLNVTIANNGCANESAINATLTTSTAGVTVTQGSSFYPNLAIGASGANSVPFKVSTSSTFVCGTNINFTLNLTYAGGSKSVAFTVPTCGNGEGSQSIPASSLTLSDPQQTDRFSRDGNPSTCSGKLCTGSVGSSSQYNYKTFTFTNSAATAACITVTLDATGCGNEIESQAYLGSTYNPPTFVGDPKLCANYLGDSAIGGLGTSVSSVSYSFNVPALSDFVVVVNTANTGTTCTHFSGTVSGLIDNAAGPGPCVTCTPPATPAVTPGGPTTFCAGGSVTLTSSAASGNQWYLNGAPIAGATGTSQPATASGDYTVTTTANNCNSAPAPVTTVTVNPIPATPTPSNGGTYCEGSTISLSTPAVTGAAYAWTGPNGFTSSLQNPVRANATSAYAGTYSVIVTVNGCASAAGTTSVVVVNTLPTPAPSNGGPFCTGQTISLSTPAVSGATYAWTGPNGFTSSLQNPTHANATVADAGTYFVTVTVNGCPSASGTTQVVVNPTPPAPVALNGGPFCAGSTISLSTPGVANATYAWTGPNGYNSSQQNPARPNATTAYAGTYSVTVTVSGCTSPAGTTNVVVNAMPATPAASNSGPYCAGATIVLSTPFVSGATYAWTGPNGFTSSQQNPTHLNATAADAGAYSVTVTVNGCTSAAGTTNVVVNILPTPAPSNGGPFCTGQTISLSTPAVSGATYAWTGPNGFTSSQQNPTRANATAADAGTYSVTITAGGCSSNAGTTAVVVNPKPATPPASNGGPYCEGSTIGLSTPAVSGATYSWTGPNGFTSAQQNPILPNATAANFGTYAVTVTVTGCTSAAGTTNVIDLNAAPVASNGGPYCARDTILLSTPMVSGATYAWTGPNGFTSTAQNPTHPNATAADAGTYSVIVTTSGCSSLAGSTSVVVNTVPTPSPANGGPYCVGATIALATPIVAGATYAWSGPNGFTSSLPNPTRVSATTAYAGTYSVTVTVNGCTSAAGTTNVVVSAIPATPAASNGGPFCAGSTISLSTPLVSGATYAWTGPNGYNSSQQNPTRTNATTADAGTYSVTVTVSGCTSPAGTTNVVVHAIPATPAASNNGPYCPGSTIELSTPFVGSATYAWTGPNGFTSSEQYPSLPNATAADAGVYSVTVTATVNGCTSAAGTTNVVVNPSPATPVATNGGPYCVGATISLSTPTVSGATYSWSGPDDFSSSQQNPTRVTTSAAFGGTYSVYVIVNGCASDAGKTNVVLNVVSASNDGPYCPGRAISLFASYVSGATYAWTGPNGFTSSLQNPTISNVTAASAGTYYVTASANGCPSSAASTFVSFISPSIYPSGPATFCAGGSVTLNSSDFSGLPFGNQWLLNGTPISGATNDTYVATASGSYTNIFTFNGCSIPSNPIVVTALPNNSTISTASTLAAGAVGTATVANYGAGASYSWTITNGSSLFGLGTPTLRFTAGNSGVTVLNITVLSAGCVDASSASVTILPGIATVTPSAGNTAGGTNVTIAGSGFQSGGSVTFGAFAATKVVRVDANTITATTPAHATGPVTVAVTNPDSFAASRASGFNYVVQQFDANGDGVIDPSDIFYLINYIFLGGPPPKGPGGMMSGDANGDKVVDPSDIFYIVNYIFLGGPVPASEPGLVSAQAVVGGAVSGSVTLGEPTRRGNHYTIPVIVAASPGSAAPQSLSLRVNFRGGPVRNAVAHSADGMRTLFEISRPTENTLSYLVTFDGLTQGVVAEIELDEESGANVSVDIDPAVTLFANRAGTRSATPSAGTLQVSGTKIAVPKQRDPAKEIN